jgi:hypothetical protein
MAEREMWGRAVSPDSSRIIEIENSPVKLLLLCGGGVLMAGVCAAAAIPLYPNSHPGIVLQIVMYFGVVFFALCSVVAAWRLLLTSHGPVVTITPEGIRDTRVAAELIPWSAVRSVQTWEYSRQKIMVLAIDPAVERKLTLTKLARWSRGPNRALGADGLCIATTGLKIDYPALLSLCQQRAGIPAGR